MQKRSSGNQDYLPVVPSDNEEGKVYQQGRWTENEKIKYIVFLEVHMDKFVKTNKRLWKIYKALSIYVRTRNPQQCRSHHRKLLLRYQSLQGIIENGKKYFSSELYEREICFYKQSHMKDNRIEINYTRVPRAITKRLPSFQRQPQKQKTQTQTFGTAGQNRPSDFISYQNNLLPVPQPVQFWNSMQLAYMTMMASNPFLTPPFISFWHPY